MRRTMFMLLIITSLLIAGPYATAGPNRDEVISARCLVPDWSKTSGGASSDLSPNGKTLIYQSANKVWVLPNVDKYTLEEYSSGPTQFQDSWPLPVDYSSSMSTTGSAVNVTVDRDSVDWSPDGSKVALVYDGWLFLVENLDSTAKTAKISLLADSSVTKPKDARRLGTGVRFPEWSPDGTRLSYFRRTNPEGSHSLYDLCVLDLRSGTETVLAHDAFPSGTAKQRWSPDGKSVIYEAVEQETNGGRSRHLSVVSVDGKESKTLAGVNTGSAWCVKTNKIVYQDLSTSENLGLIVSEPDAKNPKQITQYVPPAEKKARQFARLKRLREIVLKEDNSWLSSGRLANLKAGKMNEGEMTGILYMDLFARDAQESGREFANRAKAILESASRGDYLASTADIANAYDLLGDQGQARFFTLQRVLLNFLREAEGNNPHVVDRHPVWSPDGKSIAFIRSNTRRYWDEEQLMIVDTASGKERLLFSADGISDINWTADGRILAHVSRNLAIERFPDDPENFLVMSSYPEIWLIQPK